MPGQPLCLVGLLAFCARNFSECFFEVATNTTNQTNKAGGMCYFFNMMSIKESITILSIVVILSVIVAKLPFKDLYNGTTRGSRTLVRR